MQRTLAIIKPDAYQRKLAGKIIDIILQNDFTIAGIKVLRLTAEKAGQFYAVHTGKPFFEDLTSFMSSGKIMVLALEAPDAIERWRTVMGATDPAKAQQGTIRKMFGTAVNRNVCHGSDAPETAKTEVSFFFDENELVSEV
ncbi:MAG: nucleoside-diphosphate kinase [Chitinivibrionales bacterium]